MRQQLSTHILSISKDELLPLCPAGMMEALEQLRNTAEIHFEIPSEQFQ